MHAHRDRLMPGMARTLQLTDFVSRKHNVAIVRDVMRDLIWHPGVHFTQDNPRENRALEPRLRGDDMFGRE